MFTLDGNYVNKFGTRGTGRGQLNNPSGITTDKFKFVDNFCNYMYSSLCGYHLLSMLCSVYVQLTLFCKANLQLAMVACYSSYKL